MEVVVTDKEEYRQFDRLAGIKAFHQKHGTFKLPNCYVCSAARNDKYVKVQKITIDYEPEKDWIVFILECHGDKIELRQKLKELLKLDKVDLRMVFKPNQGFRENGVLKTTLQRQHKLDTNHPY